MGTDCKAGGWGGAGTDPCGVGGTRSLPCLRLAEQASEVGPRDAAAASVRGGVRPRGGAPRGLSRAVGRGLDLGWCACMGARPRGEQSGGGGDRPRGGAPKGTELAGGGA